jgi:hypothetical protein
MAYLVTAKWNYKERTAAESTGKVYIKKKVDIN